MACGKSTIGKRVARALKYSFLDLDQLIEERSGQAIATIFSEQGETGFRALERQCLREASAHDRVVISVGGGALASASNLHHALDRGVVIYIRLPVSELVERLVDSKTVRPLMLGENGRPLPRPALHERVASMLEARERYYLRSDLIVNTAGLTPAESAEKVLESLKRQFGPLVIPD